MSVRCGPLWSTVSDVGRVGSALPCPLVEVEPTCHSSFKDDAIDLMYGPAGALDARVKPATRLPDATMMGHDRRR